MNLSAVNVFETIHTRFKNKYKIVYVVLHVIFFLSIKLYNYKNIILRQFNTSS